MSEKWWDMSDDELDDLFREASDKVEIPFDSSALDKLKQKIDFKPIPQLKPSQGFKKRWIALAGFLIFFGVALLYTFFGKEGDSKLNNNSNIISEYTLPTSGDVDKKIPITANSTNTESKIIESNIAQKKTSTIKVYSMEKYKHGLADKKGEKYDLNIEKSASNRKSFKAIQQDNLLENKPLDFSKTKPTDETIPTINHELSGNNSTILKEENKGNDVKILSSSKNSKKLSSLAKSRFSNNNQVYNSSVYQEINVPISTPLIISENKFTKEEKISRTDFYNVDFLANKDTKPLQINIHSESPMYADVPPIVMKQPKFSRFGIRLAIAPEINSIEKMETSAVVGSMFAFLLEYRLTKKLTLQTGVNYSNKKYTGNFEYYRAWVNANPQPININGICKVIDIPINLRLNAFHMKRNTFFISGGVSSYIMSDEIYTYNYAYGFPKVRDWTGNSASFYWSTLNLSTGVERKMNKHFTLQIEPFLKTPLVGVGRGLVNLYSSGLLFSTKYEF